MSHEYELNRQKEGGLAPSFPLYALEGIGGSGKSHVGRLLREELSEEGLSIIAPKIAGLGDSPRVQRLKAIKEARFTAYRQGLATEKQLQDQQKDKIFRLAMYQQIRDFNREKHTGNFDVGIVDRTPMTVWVYNMATNPDNPYLDEILREGLQATEDLGLTAVMLFDLPVTTAYARIIARYSVGEDNPDDFILASCESIGANIDQTKEIRDKTRTLLEQQENIQAKAFEGWDFIPIEVAERERELHKEALAMAQENFGLSYAIIDAEAPIENVVSNIRSKITLP